MSIIFAYGLEPFAALFWFKVLTLALIFFFINNYKKKELYYYRNLGVSKLFLWISTIAIDLSIFILFVILTIQIK